MEEEAEEEEEERGGGGLWGYRGGTTRVRCKPTFLSPKEEGKYLDRRRILFPLFSVCSRSIPCCHD